MKDKTLIACVGNIFLGDDGFGVEVARRLASSELPEHVRVTDYGIRGIHLAYDLADGYGTTIIVDAMSRGGDPGTIYVIEHEQATPVTSEPLASSQLLNAHGMQPDVVLGLLGVLEANPGRVIVVGCEPASLDHGMGLSPPVAAAVDEAVRVVTGLAAEAAPVGADGQQAATSVSNEP